MDIIGSFMGALPYSLIILIIPIIFFWMRSREQGETIKNRVEIFFKGGTKAYYECLIEKGIMMFSIEEVVYKEPVLHHPRLEKVKNQLYRTYLYAEGIGSIDVPPLTVRDRRKIIEVLVSNELIEDDDKKDKIEDYTDEDLIKYITFYNFDIDQITDKPITRLATTMMTSFEHLVMGLAVRLEQFESGGGNLRAVALWLVGAISGFGFAWALTLKGVI